MALKRSLIAALIAVSALVTGFALAGPAAAADSPDMTHNSVGPDMTHN